MTLPLLKAGAQVTAVDNSAEMLTILREKLSQEGLSADVYEMDVRHLAFDEPFDLVLIPFHAFAELPTADDQRQTLEGIARCLTENGRFICALHNPVMRLQSVDGQLKLMGKFPLEDRQGQLLVWTLQRYNPQNHTVEVKQFFEEYNAEGLMISKRLQELNVNFIDKADFEAMFQAAGFRLIELYGDYSYGAFEVDKSPFMIWVLGR